MARVQEQQGEELGCPRRSCCPSRGRVDHRLSAVGAAALSGSSGAPRGVGVDGGPSSVESRVGAGVGGEPALLKKKKGTATQERREGSLHGENGHGVPEPRVEPADHIGHLVAVVDGGAELGETVGAVLETREEGDDGRAP